MPKRSTIAPRNGGTQRVALVTGASRGIGRAIAGRLAGDGFAVLLNASNRVSLEAAASELAAGGATVHAFAADLSDRDAIALMVAEVRCR